VVAFPQVSPPKSCMHLNDKGTCMLIDVAISGDRNVIKKLKNSKI
jgi:hypothetical protein